jgi:hypothetical protein
MIVLVWRDPAPALELQWRLDDPQAAWQAALRGTEALAAVLAPPGPPGAGVMRYEHQQVSPLAVWTVNHNFGYRPDVTLYSAGGMQVEAEILHTSLNQAIATFDIPFSGMALCE